MKIGDETLIKSRWQLIEGQTVWVEVYHVKHVYLINITSNTD